MRTREELVATILAAARAAVEAQVKFRHQGRSFERGLDCAGLVVHCVEQAGLTYFDREGYSRQPKDNQLEAALEMQPCLVRIPLGAAEDGDVLLIKFRSDPQHLAIKAGPNIIHAWETVGKVCEHGLDEWRAGKVVAAYRIVEVES